MPKNKIKRSAMPKNKNKKSKKQTKTQQKVTNQDEIIEEGSDFGDEPIYNEDYVPDTQNEDLDYDDQEDVFDKLENVDNGNDAGDDEGDYDYDEDDNEEDDEIGDVQDEDENKVVEERKILVTEERANIIMENLRTKKSLQGLKLFLKLFRSAALLGEDTENQNRGSKYSYEIEDGTVFNQIIQFAVEEVPEILTKFTSKVILVDCL